MTGWEVLKSNRWAILAAIVSSALVGLAWIPRDNLASRVEGRITGFGLDESYAEGSVPLMFVATDEGKTVTVSVDRESQCLQGRRVTLLKRSYLIGSRYTLAPFGCQPLVQPAPQ